MVTDDVTSFYLSSFFLTGRMVVVSLFGYTAHTICVSVAYLFIINVNLKW